MNSDVAPRASAGREFAPFASAALLAWIAVLIGTPVDAVQYGLAWLLLLVAVGLRLARLRPLSHGIGTIVPSLIFLAALGLVRNAAGGISAGVSGVAMVPVFFIALHGGRRELYSVLAAMAAFYLVPIVLVGPPSYPHTQYRAALLSVAVAWIVGVATQELVSSIRHQAKEGHLRERMLEDVRDVLGTLYASTDARSDVCVAARDIGSATCALLYEELGASGLLRSTAMIGLDAPQIEIPADRRTAVRDALERGAPVLLTEDVEAHVGSPELWVAAGRPQTILYEPLMNGPEAIGVLVVGWPAEIRPTGPEITVVKLLAHEAANVIHRADIMSQLTDMAQTDPLTGLLNRRAWDASVSHAMKESPRFTIAMLDFDHFKAYNDTHGHPAGDRLLRETAAMWQHLLRTGDLLARLGGEEFGLLLLDCDTEHASDVIARLRSSMYGEETCSAGFAERAPGEAVESVMARADAALYEAKTSGRDRACMSPAPGGSLWPPSEKPRARSAVVQFG